MTFGSLFAGIGGLDLGLERAGMRCVWQVEIDEYCRRVLAKHWPDVCRHDDVKTFPPQGEWGCDLICGGFPCQDISNAGKRAGITGKRSGLWTHFARIVRVVRPKIVVVENVPALTLRGLWKVLGNLAAMGFDAEWGCLPAAAFGAPHPRWRLFIVAHRQPGPLDLRQHERDATAMQRKAKQRSEPNRVNAVPASDSNRSRREVPQQIRSRKSHTHVGGQDVTPESESRWAGQRWREQFAAYCQETGRLFWPDAQPRVCGVASRVPRRVDRLRGLGNAVVPQVAEWIGRRIMEHR